MTAPLNLAALAMWRLEAQLTPEQCRAWFGVGPETMERVESGEVKPEPELAERIERAIGNFSTPHAAGCACPAAPLAPATPCQCGEAGAFSGGGGK